MSILIDQMNQNRQRDQRKCQEDERLEECHGTQVTDWRMIFGTVRKQDGHSCPSQQVDIHVRRCMSGHGGTMMVGF